MSEALGQIYVERHFPGESKATATKLVGAIASVMNEQMSQLDWMSPETKLQARGKLDKIEALIGYPDTWRRYDFAVARDDFAGNALAARAFEARRQLAKAGKPFDRDEWLMDRLDLLAPIMGKVKDMILAKRETDEEREKN